MQLTELLGSSFDCACGKQHTVPTEEFIYGEDSFEAIPGLINTYSTHKRCLIIADTRTYGVAGREIERICKTGGVRCGHLIVADAGGESPVVDDRTRDILLQQTTDASLLIAVGSGVINDLTKWTAFLQNINYLVVATAASKNGYGSDNEDATIKGIKV